LPSVKSDSPILDFISSDETLDRYDEVICTSGWRLDTYRQNPVFQNAHQHDDIIHTLGRALQTDLRQVNGRTALVQTIQFATDVNPIARIAHGLYSGGFLHSVSVGFIPIRWEDAPSDPSTLTSQPSTQQLRRKYLEQELLEVSAVAIPANPNALALALKSGALEKSDLRDTLDILRQTLTEPPPRNTQHEPRTTLDAPPFDLSPLLQLTHQIKQLLKKC
jgi:phage head maturation protease